jgi:plasmid stability protein
MVRKKAAPAQIKIRLPEALRRDLEREAARHGRTLNGEIVYRLTQPFIQADREAVAVAAVETTLEKMWGPPDEVVERTDARGRPFWTKLWKNPLSSVPAPKLTEEEEKLIRELRDRVQQSQKNDKEQSK